MQMNQNKNIPNNIPISDMNLQTASNYVFYIKILYLTIIVIVTTLFGLLPLCFNNCRKDTRLLNYANAFSGGIFLGIGFLHLFPEANENFELYFSSPEGKSSFIYGWPMSYLLAFLSYSLILYLEKVAFNSHSLIAHTHKTSENLDNNLNEPLLENHENEKIFHDCTHDLYDDSHKNKNDSNVNLNHSSDSEGIGEDEQIIRNVISTKGQFSSLLQSRNLSK
jgi:zinc transporter 1/2/3